MILLRSIIDISNWTQDWSKQVTGTRTKVWVKGQDSYGYSLFKIPKSSANENWAELVSSELGKIIGLRTMNVHLAVNNKQKGVLLENIKPQNAIMEDGGELIKGIYEEFDPADLKGYTIETIMKSVEKYHLQANIIAMCLFDGLIANQDRHCENWAVLRFTHDKAELAPLYDNGASLGFNSNEDQLKKLLLDKVMFEAFTNRSKSLIEVNGRRKPRMRVLLSYLKETYNQLYVKEIERFANIEYNDVIKIVNQIPSSWMNEVQKEWVCKLINYRSNWLKDI
ncbi:HipA domain-containing protein [Shouchella clausii]|uniref:HipA domain-containing protein n=1 Tax=Shouchella clausii TaxID=79880 RepID=UPI003983321D